MAQLISPDYGEQFLFPRALEEWVPADHPARFLREFVDELDLAGLGFVMPAGAEGRPPYAPSLLLKIWLYGYFHRIRSTRKLEVACREHLSLLWLSGLIQPDHNSLWRFWRDNQKALRGIFKQSVQLAVRTGAVGLALQALDGTKIEAAASGYSGWSKEYMERLLSQLDAALDQIQIQVLEENRDVEPAGYRLPAGLAQRQALRQEIKKGLAQLAADGRQSYHPIEPEARRMKLANGTTRFAYNAQAVADERAGIIVAAEVTRQETDSGQLAPMIELAGQNLGLGTVQTLTVADAGYGSGADIVAAQQGQMEVLVPPSAGCSDARNPYASPHFHYDEPSRSVTCPRGEKLDYQGRTFKRGQWVERYRCRCPDCRVRSQCTGDPKGRQIEIWPHTPAVQAMRARLEAPAAYRRWQQRGQIIEPRFGQIKQQEGFRRWTAWGLQNVRTQWAMLCTTLNLRVLYRRWQGLKLPALSQAAGWPSSLRLFVLAHRLPPLFPSTQGGCKNF